jgi:hypothetical protein
MEAGLYGTASGAGNQELGTQAGTAQTPSFWDQLGGSLAGSLGKTVGGGN